MTLDPGSGDPPRPVSAEPEVRPIAATPLPTTPMPTLPLPRVTPPGPAGAYPGAAALAPGGYRGAAALPTRDPGPRPPQVTLAVILTFVAIGLSFLGLILLYVSQIHTVPPDGDPSVVNDNNRAAMTAFLMSGVNVVVGTGVGVAAVFTQRGYNWARITLCVACALFAGWKLTCGGIALASILTATAPAGNYGLGTVAYSLDLVLMVLALAIITLLLLGPSHRFFSTPHRVPMPGYPV